MSDIDDGETVAGAVVRLWNGDDVVGGGFLVGAELVATCAHVVADAIGADPYAPTAPTLPVPLDFALLPDAGRLEATVERWSPIADDGTGDVALLRLTGPAPPQARMPPLRRIDRLWDHGFRVLGFPEDHSDGVWSSGLIRGEQSTRWYQLQSTAGEQRIEAGFSGSAVWDEQSGAVVGMTVASDRGDTTTAYLIPTDQVLGLDPALLPCPYVGLRPFDEEHAATFFGRGDEIDKLVDAVARTPVVAVAGPSGAGKSSLVRAGLLPRLRSAGTPIVDLRAVPGGDLDVAAPPGSVLVVDQFEELAAADPDGARLLLERIVRLTEAERVRAVLTVRWAALDEVSSPELLGVLESGTVLVAPMSRGRLREAIVGPAERSPGLAFEKGLVDRILDDAGSEPGQLPLVESLLTDLWDRRDGGYLTQRGYEAAGGVAGAVARHAERKVADVGATEDLRGLFTVLARPDRDGAFARRPVPLTELSQAQRELVPVLVDGRLLVLGARGDGETVVELAHQALIDHWPRLRTWLAEDHAFLDWRARVDTQRVQWETEEKAPPALLRGATLAEATDWLPARAEDLSPASAEYVRRSRARQRWEVRRWRIVTAVLAVLGLVAAALSVVAVDRNQVLEGQLAVANANTLGREAQNRMPADPALGARLALAAWRSDPKSPQARTALALAYFTMRSVDAELASTGQAKITRLAAGGDTAIVAGAAHLVVISGVNGPTPRTQELADTAPDQQFDLSPDGRMLAYVTADRTAVRVRDLTGTAEPATLPTPAGTTVGLPKFAPGGERLRWVTTDASKTLTVTVWDLRAGAEIPNRLGNVGADWYNVWLTPDPNRVFVRHKAPSSPDTRLVLRSLDDGAEVATMPTKSAVVGRGSGVLSCEKVDGDKPTATMVVSGIGSATPPIRFPGLDLSCTGWVSADGSALIESGGVAGPAEPMRVTDLATGAMWQLALPTGQLERPLVGAFGEPDSIAVAWSSGRPSVLDGRNSSVLRLATKPMFADRAGRSLAGGGRYLASWGSADRSLTIEDAATGERLAVVTGVRPVGSQSDFEDDLWVFAPEPFVWTVTRYALPDVRRVASYRLPASTDPEPTLPDKIGGQEVAINTTDMPSGPQLIGISDGLLAVLDLGTGQPLGAVTTLGDTPQQRAWYQLYPMLKPRPVHPGQAVVVGHDGELQVWDALRGARLGTIPTAYRPFSDGQLNSPKYAVDPTGTRLAVLTPGRAIEVWDIDSATQVRPPISVQHADEVAGFTADGYLVVREDSLAGGGSLVFVDIDRGYAAGSMPRQIYGMRVDPDQVAVTDIGVDGRQPERFLLTAGAWRDALCAVVNRPFSEAERVVLPPGADPGPPCSAGAAW